MSVMTFPESMLCFALFTVALGVILLPGSLEQRKLQQQMEIQHAER